MNDGGPAFPRAWEERTGMGIKASYVEGMTYRQWLAGMALSGFCANSNVPNREAMAVEAADATIELMQPTKGE